MKVAKLHWIKIRVSILLIFKLIETYIYWDPLLLSIGYFSSTDSL